MVAKRENRRCIGYGIGKSMKSCRPGASMDKKSDDSVGCVLFSGFCRPFVDLATDFVGLCRAGGPGYQKPRGYTGADYVSSDDPDIAADVSGYGDSGSYGALAVVQGALAVSALFFPHQSAEFLFGPGGRRSIDAHTPVFGPGGRPSIDAYTQLFRLIGVSLLSAALKSQILQGCSVAGDLSKKGCLRMNLSLVTLGAGSAIVLLNKRSTMNGIGFWVSLVTASTTFGVALAQYALTSGSGINVGRIGKDLYRDVSKLFQADKPLPLGFSSVTAALIAAGGYLLFNPIKTVVGAFPTVPSSPLPSGATTLWLLFAVGLLSEAPNAYTLKEASSQNKLKNDTWGKLWIRFGAYSLGNLSVFAPLLLAHNDSVTLQWITGLFGVASAISAAGLLESKK